MDWAERTSDRLKVVACANAASFLFALAAFLSQRRQSSKCRSRSSFLAALFGPCFVSCSHQAGGTDKTKGKEEEEERGRAAKQGRRREEKESRADKDIAITASTSLHLEERSALAFYRPVAWPKNLLAVLTAPEPAMAAEAFPETDEEAEEDGRAANLDLTFAHSR